MEDVLTQVKRVARIYEVVTTVDVGEFKNPSSENSFRGKHGTHDASDHRGCVVYPRSNTWRCFVCGQKGDVVSWVLSALYNNDPTCYPEAIRFLAELYGITCTPESDLAVNRHKIEAMLTDLSLQWADNLLHKPEILSFIEAQWGISKATCELLHIGFCESLESNSYEETLLLTGGVTDVAGSCGLVGRITFPFFRYGSVAWIIGRTPNDSKPKYKALHRTSVVEPCIYGFDLAYCAARDQDLILCEGPADAAVAIQHGHRAVALGGTDTFTEKMKVDFGELIKQVYGNKFVVFDNDINQAGLRGASRLCETLITYACDPYLVTLPRDEMQIKVDLPEYMKTHTGQDLMGLLEDAVGKNVKESKTYVNSLIQDCPLFAEGPNLKKVISVIANLDTHRADVYIRLLAEQTQLMPKGLQKDVQQARRTRKSLTTSSLIDYLELPWYAQDFIYKSAQDLWEAHTTLYLPTQVVNAEGDTVYSAIPTHVVSSIDSKHKYSLRVAPLTDLVNDEQRRRVPTEAIITDKYVRWSVGESEPYSYTNFVNGVVTKIEPAHIFKSIMQIFNTYVRYPESDDDLMLTLYVFATYIYMGLGGMPYLFLFGDRDSGKSTTADILAHLCFNSVGTGSLSGPGLYRTAHSTRPTMFIDEAEKLNNPASGSKAAALLEICNASYADCLTDKVLVCETSSEHEGWQPTGYRPFGPKVFSSTKDLHPVLKSRCVVVKTLSLSKDKVGGLKSWDAEKIFRQQEFATIRDSLRIFALTEFRKVRNEFDSITLDYADGLIGRSLQIWKPLFALSQYMDKYLDEPITKRITELAQFKTSQRKYEMVTTDMAAMLLASIHRIVKDDVAGCGVVEHPKHGTVIKPSVLVGRLREDLMLQQVAPEVYQKLDSLEITNRLLYVGAISTGKKRVSMRHNGKVVNAYPFNLEALETFIANRGWFDREDMTVEY